jgi:ABC-2 type transport system ATP-binding protein
LQAFRPVAGSLHAPSRCYHGARRGRRRRTSRYAGRRTLTPPLLSAQAVSRRYGRRVALAPTDLEVGPDEAVALIGPNGAGKSTLLAILAGALAPTGGRVTTSARTGWVPQQPAHYGRLTPRENLELFGALEEVADPAADADRLVELLDLPDDGRLALQLSAGNQQRLNLALALLGDPSVLLLDEPSASLDPRQRRRLWARAADVRGRGGAVLFATQNLEELERFATRVLVLLDGSVVFDGPYEEYEAHPEQDVFA